MRELKNIPMRLLFSIDSVMSYLVPDADPAVGCDVGDWRRAHWLLDICLGEWGHIATQLPLPSHQRCSGKDDAWSRKSARSAHSGKMGASRHRRRPAGTNTESRSSRLSGHHAVRRKLVHAVLDTRLAVHTRLRFRQASRA